MKLDVFVRREALLPVVTRDVVVSLEDGATVTLQPGLARVAADDAAPP